MSVTAFKIFQCCHLQHLHFFRCCLQSLKFVSNVPYRFYNFLAMSSTALKNFKLCWKCNKNDIEETIKMTGCNTMQHDVAAIRACCSLIRSCCSRYRIFSGEAHASVVEYLQVLRTLCCRHAQEVHSRVQQIRLFFRK